MTKVFYICHPDNDEIQLKAKIVDYLGSVTFTNNINDCDYVIIDSCNGCFSKYNYHYIEIAKYLNKKILTSAFNEIFPTLDIIEHGNKNYYCKLQLTPMERLISKLNNFNIIVTNKDVRMYNKEQKNILLDYLKEFDYNLISYNNKIIKYYNASDIFEVCKYMKEVYVDG